MQTAFAEKADQLVKVGNKSATFNVTTVASPIQIPLTQLAARGGTESAGGYSETIVRREI